MTHVGLFSAVNFHMTIETLETLEEVNLQKLQWKVRLLLQEGETTLMCL